MKTTIQILAVLTALTLTGCSTIVKNAQKLDQTDIVDLDITGRWTTTTYTVEEKDGVTVRTYTHNNPWLAKPAKVVRKSPTAK